MKKIFKYRFILFAAVIALAVLLLKLVADHFELNVIAVNTLTGAFFTGVFFTISIVFTGAMSDFKEAQKIPGEMASLLKSMRSDALLLSLRENGSEQGKALAKHVENLLSIITCNLRQNCWHNQQLDEEVNQIQNNITELWAKDVSTSILYKMRDNLVQLERLSNRLDYIAYSKDSAAAYVICDIAITAVLIIFVFTKNEWGLGGMTLFVLISFVMTAIVRLIHDMDNPFEYGKNTNADVDTTVLFQLGNRWKME
ncbi:MAG: hypothetical protein PHF74_08005 [Dehalococcoidales bacterium]|nr:hypothetical protein [Dehalococcoidales bacterium]